MQIGFADVEQLSRLRIEEAATTGRFIVAAFQSAATQQQLAELISFHKTLHDSAGEKPEH